MEVDPRARARSSDPGTSHEAAASVKHIRESQIEIYMLISDYGPCHDERLIEIVEEHGVLMSESGVRTRRSELVDLGLVRDSGERVLTKAGRRSIVWEVVK